MIREVVQAEQQTEWDARQRRDAALRRLVALDADLVEWTFVERPAGVRLIAEFWISDPRRPLTELAAILRRAAEEVQRLAHDHSPVARG